MAPQNFRMASLRLAVVAAALAPLASGRVNGTVYFRGGSFVFEAGKSDASGVAYGSFSAMNESVTGFGQLSIQTNTEGLYSDR